MRFLTENAAHRYRRTGVRGFTSESDAPTDSVRARFALRRSLPRELTALETAPLAPGKTEPRTGQRGQPGSFAQTHQSGKTLLLTEGRLTSWSR